MIVADAAACGISSPSFPITHDHLPLALHSVLLCRRRRRSLSLFRHLALHAEDPPPSGFVALFDGKDLTGWRGGSTFDPRVLAAMPEDQRKAQIDKWTATLTAVNAKTGKPHWYSENGELVNDGFGDYATTEKDYGDIELLVDYKIRCRSRTPASICAVRAAGADLGFGRHRGKKFAGSAPTKAPADSGTTTKAHPAGTRWCWPTNPSASGTTSTSSWSARA